GWDPDSKRLVRVNRSAPLGPKSAQAVPSYNEGGRAGPSPARYHNPRVVGSSPTALFDRTTNLGGRPAVGYAARRAWPYTGASLEPLGRPLRRSPPRRCS